MSIELKYSIRVNNTYPIVEVIGELIRKKEKEDTIHQLIQAALIAIDKVEDCNGTLLKRTFIPERRKNGNYVWFTVAFKSFEDVADFMNRMSHLG